MSHIMDRSEGTKSYGVQMFQASVDESYKMGNGFQFLHQAVEKIDESPKLMLDYIVGHVFSKMTAEVVIRKHGQVAIDALFKEFKRLHNLEVFEGMLASDLSQEQMRNALASINIVKEKQCGGIKGRSVADGRKQKIFYKKYDITSTTVSTDAILMILMIDAWEQRVVGTSDVTGAYLQADMEDFLILRAKAFLICS